jgi:4-alpha-glucanotransferase
MRELEILSLEVERMPKAYGVEFGMPAEYPYLSVSTPSTHDMSNIRLWWRENRERTQRYFNDVLGLEGVAPLECSAELCEKIMRRQLSSCSILMIAPLQDWLSIDEQVRSKDVPAERINDPSNPDQHWCYRMHLHIEELLSAEKFNAKVKSLSRR